MEKASQVFSGAHHFLKIQVNGQEMRVQAVRTRVEMYSAVACWMNSSSRRSQVYVRSSKRHFLAK